MARLRDIKGRISSVRKTRKVTRAMQMVAAARLRRTQESVMQWRTHVEKMTGIVERLLSRTDPIAHPLLSSREARRLEVVVITPDRGLCGGFNLAICQQVEHFIAQNQSRFEVVSLTIVGKKGCDYFKRRPVTIRQEFGEVPSKLDYEWISSFTKHLIGDYLAGTFDVLYFFYHRFKSVLQQIVIEERVIPFKEAWAQDIPIGYFFEPSRRSVLEKVLLHYLETRIYAVFVESVTSEHAARMTAMNLATRNALEMVEMLTLAFNKARQEVITKELMDIVGGAEALK